MKVKHYHELTFADDFMFCKVLQNNEELCKKMLESILGRKIDRIVKAEKQHSIEITPDGKGVRFDVYLEGDETLYDVEMQNTAVPVLPLRARYYQSMADLDCMDRGMGYNELKKSVIIFICTFDPFGGGLGKYTVRQLVEETGAEYDDGTEKVFLYATELAKNVPEELGKLLAYVAGMPPESDLTLALEEQVERARGHQEWRREYMTLYEMQEAIKKESLEEGRAEGREEGREEGRAEKVAEIAKAMREEGIPVDVIVKVTGLTEEELAQL